MEEYRSNSNKSREALSTQPEKKVEKVISCTAKIRKKSGMQRFADVFMPEDVGDIKSYIVTTVVIPAIKKAIMDAMDMLLYGETGSSRKAGSASKVSYRSFYDKGTDRRDSRPTRVSGFDYDNIIFAGRGDAEACLDAMFEIISTYGTVSVADLYDLADMPPTNNYMLDRYGWADLSGSTTVRVRDGYTLKLPRAVPLELNL